MSKSVLISIQPKWCELIDSIDFELEDIGKTVFLSKEEAQKALDERR